MKYGLPISEADKIIDRHFVVMLERKRHDQLHVEHALRALPPIFAKPAPKVTVRPAPVAVQPEPASAPVEPAPVVVPSDLRADLGLR